MSKNEALFEAITKGKRKDVADIVQKLIDDKGDVVDLLNETMIPAMRFVGDKFSRNEIYVPEMLIAARAMQTGLDMIEPLLADSGHKARAKVCIGTDLGVDCSVEKYEAAVNDGAQVVCLSALLTTTMPYMKNVVEKLKDRGVKIVIGGAPITEEYAQEIGADGYGDDANDAVNAVEKCLAMA